MTSREHTADVLSFLSPPHGQSSATISVGVKYASEFSKVFCTYSLTQFTIFKVQVKPYNGDSLADFLEE